MKDQFGDWQGMFKDFIESSNMDDLFKYLKSEVAKGKKIAPLSKDVFRCFRETSKDKLRIIIAGMCPYHTWSDGYPVADGLCMSCSYTKKKGIQPSLQMWYDEIARVYDSKNEKTNDDYGDMRVYARQGVLCYNVALTTEEGKPMSHENVWSKFNQYFWEKVINQYFRGIPIMFLGQSAAKSEQYLTPMLHYPFRLSHPASAAHSGTDRWDSANAFKRIDKILKDNNRDSIWWPLDIPF